MKDNIEQERINENKEKLFSINIYINKEENIIIPMTNIDVELVDIFKEIYGVDLMKIFRSKKYKDIIESIVSLIGEENTKNENLRKMI
ncbi:hypothetical protein [Clostridium baratii]|uniref:hypothetical protein n=1 Tax=Clostridium baratii TaxID=1561 RepID=UPI0030CAEA3D